MACLIHFHLLLLVGVLLDQGGTWKMWLHSLGVRVGTLGKKCSTSVTLCVFGFFAEAKVGVFAAAGLGPILS